MDDAWDLPLEDVFEERADDPGQPLCPHCLSVTRPGAHFCHVCVCPLTFYAGTGPLERVWAWPWIVWQAGRTPWPRPIHAWGTLVWGAGLALAWAANMALLSLRAGASFLAAIDGPYDVLVFAMSQTILAVTGACGAVLLLRAWRNRRRLRVDPWPDEPQVDP